MGGGDGLGNGTGKGCGRGLGLGFGKGGGRGLGLGFGKGSGRSPCLCCCLVTPCVCCFTLFWILGAAAVVAGSVVLGLHSSHKHLRKHDLVYWASVGLIVLGSILMLVALTLTVLVCVGAISLGNDCCNSPTPPHETVVVVSGGQSQPHVTTVTNVHQPAPSYQPGQHAAQSYQPGHIYHPGHPGPSHQYAYPAPNYQPALPAQIIR